MNRVESADKKLQEFIAKWSKHYKVNKSEAINILSNAILNINNDSRIALEERKIEEPKILFSQDKHVIKGDLKGIAFVKINGELVYVSKDIDGYIPKQ